MYRYITIYSLEGMNSNRIFDIVLQCVKMINLIAVMNTASIWTEFATTLTTASMSLYSTNSTVPIHLVSFVLH